MMQAEQQAKLGGAAAGKPAIEAQQAAQLQQLMAQLPPDEAEAMMAAVSGQEAGVEPEMEDALPGGGGAPIRGET